jgi:hypothetical protein
MYNMPFNGDFYTNSEDKAPSYDFYTQNMKQRGILPGSWQMRQAYASGSSRAEGSNPSNPSFQTSYSRNVGDRLGGNTSTYNARGVTGTTSVPTSGESYNSQRYGKTGSSEEETIRRVVGTVGKKAKEKKSKEKTPGTGSPGDQGSDDGMAIGSNNTNSNKFGKNAQQSGNQSGGANIQAGGDINGGRSIGFGATNTGTGVQQIGGHGSRQTNNQFMFDPNHPAWSGGGGGGETPKEKKPPKDKGKPKGDKDTKWAPEDMGERDMGLPRKGQPGTNTGGMPSQYEGMGGDYDATGTGSTPRTSMTPPDQGDNFGGGSGRVVKKTRRTGTPGQAEQPYPKPGKRKVGGQGPSWEQEQETTPPKYPGAIDTTEGSPTTGLPKAPSGSDIEKFRGGVPAGTGQTPTTGAPPTVENSTGAPKGPGFFGRMWNKAADRVMTAPGGGPINFGPGAEYERVPDRGLPQAPTPMGEIGPGSRGIGPGSRVMGAIGAGDSPASARIQQVNPRGTYGHPMNGDFGGRGPNRRGPQTTRFGDMGMGVPMQGSVPTGGMPSQYEGMGQDYNAGGPQPGRFDMNPITGGVRPDFGAPNYTGPSRHPQAPTPDFTFGMQSEVAPMMQGMGMADMEMKRQAFRQRSRRPGT